MSILLKSSEKINEKDLSSHLQVAWKDFITSWHNLQGFWLNNAYRTFNDIEKYLILIYLIRKTFYFYSSNFKRYTFEEYYSGSSVEIENISIIKIAKDLKISKETARRKVLELDKEGIFKKDKKRLIIERSKLGFQKPERVLKMVSSFLSQFSKSLFKEKKIKQAFEKDDVHSFFLKNFTSGWQYFLELQIQYCLLCKRFFKDYETWYVFGVILINQNLEFQKNTPKIKIYNNIDYFQKLMKSENRGINAMSIAEISGIPRATVVRKLNSLLKKDIIYIDKRKLYFVKKFPTSVDIHNEIVFFISTFASRIYNQMIFKD